MAATRRDCIIGGAAVVAAATAIGAALTHLPAGADDGLPRGLRPARNPLPMPDLAVYGADGSPLEFRDLNGKPALVLFWATWCGVCRGEMPKIERLQATLAGRAHIVAASIDEGGMPRVRAYLDRSGLDNLTAHIDHKGVVATMMGIRRIPTALALDRTGHIVASGAGRIDWDSDAAANFIASL